MSVLVMVRVIMGLLYLPFSLYSGWLLYNHVGATELMWFLWWMAVPMFVVSSIAAAAIGAAGKVK